MEMTFYLKYGNEAGRVEVLDTNLNVMTSFVLEDGKSLKEVYNNLIDLLKREGVEKDGTRD